MSTYGRRKALGQHFLKDTGIVQQIAEKAVEEAKRHACVGMMEIGPGKGALTLPLLEHLHRSPEIKNFLVVERDRDFAGRWKVDAEAIRAEKFPHFSVEEGDFLDLPESHWLKSTPLAVVSNLPYSAGTAILNRLARQGKNIPVMVLMFQAEVAKRLRAEPSTPPRGSLSVWIQNLWDVQKLMAVPPKAFSPPPQVDSEVVVLTRRNSPQIPGSSDPQWEASWESLLKTCFAQRRKMLRSLLHSRHPWQNALELSGVDGTKRAEALRWPEWDQLFQALREVTTLSHTP